MVPSGNGRTSGGIAHHAGVFLGRMNDLRNHALVPDQVCRRLLQILISFIHVQDSTRLRRARPRDRFMLTERPWVNPRLLAGVVDRRSFNALIA